MPRKNGHAFKEDEDRATGYSIWLSRAIEALIEQRGYTQSRFAREIGLSRSTMNTILNSTDGKNLWRLPTLCAAARVLNAPLWGIMKAAEEMLEKNAYDDTAVHKLNYLSIVRSTEPKSPERLLRLTGQVVSSYLLFSGDSWADDFRCAPEDFKAGVPQFYEDYMTGKLDDDDATAYLCMAKKHWDGKGPFWVALRDVYPVK